MELKILHTNDVHSNYENFSKIMSKINEIRDESTILLDAGDFADFKRLELQGTDGLAAVELLEYAGYDAIAVGNNETFNGLDILSNMANNSKVPFLSSNLFKIGIEEIKGIKRSVIINKKGLRILIIGLSPNLGDFTTLAGMETKPYIEAIKEEITYNRENYDLCIVLSHLGMDSDRKIAEIIDEVNIIIGGHFHILMEKPEIVNDTIIHTSGSFGEHLGMISINIKDKKVNLIEYFNTNTQSYSCCDEVLDILKTNKEKAIDTLSKPLYNIDRDLWHDVIEENPISNLLADALVDMLGCDIGIINSGVLNGGIKKGPVSDKKLLELGPSPLNPTYFEIKGRYLKDALEKSLDSDICLMDGKGPGFRGKYVGRLHVSNAVIEHNGKKIHNIIINGKELEEDKFYSVATSDYLQRGTGYEALRNNINERYDGKYIRDVLRAYVCKKEFIEKAFNDRWILK